MFPASGAYLLPSPLDGDDKMNELAARGPSMEVHIIKEPFTNADMGKCMALGFIHMFVTRLVDPARPRWHAQLMMREMAQPTSACAELVRDNIRPIAGILTGILEEVLPVDLPAWKRFLVGISIISQCVIHCQNRPIIEQLAGPENYSHFDADALAEHITNFSLAALGLREPLTAREVPS